MGKSVRPIKTTTKKTVKAIEKDICKHKSLRVNLKEFVQKLHKKNQNITTKQYLIRIHNFINNFRNVAKKVNNLSKTTYDYVRVCVGCKNWGDRSKLIECKQCEDFFHISCVNSEIEDPKYWMCLTCTQLAESLVNRDSQLNRYYSPRAQTKNCAKCKQQANSIMISCTRCNFDFHDTCVAGSAKKGICLSCDKIIKDQLKNRKSLFQKTLYDYFEVVENNQGTIKIYQKSEADTQVEELTITYCEQLNLKAPIKLKEHQIQNYKSQLLYAIYSKKMQYSEQLVFEAKLPVDICCQDPTLQFINKKDEKAYKEYKKQPIGPYRMHLIEGMGYDVKADKAIPKGTIICEYVGEVITKRDALHYLQNDSLMELSFGMDADSSLIIKPEKYTNMARFINGVNNSDPNREKKINVQTVRVTICGRPTVLLFAKRKIEKDESLIYDYNAGGLDKYQTHQFI